MVTVDTPAFKVVEDNGNVVGLVRTPTGGTAQFRLRFNYQDGDGGADGLDEPAANMLFDSPHISVNNLLGSVDNADFPMGDGPGNSAGTLIPNGVPRAAVAIVCEGRAADEFNNATTLDPNPPGVRVKGFKVIEGVYRLSDATPGLTDAVTMAGNKFDVDLFDGDGSRPMRLELTDARDNGQPKIRARNDISVTNVDSGSNGDVEGDNSELLVPTGNNVNASLGSGVGTGVEDTNEGFYELAFDQVDDPSGGTLNAGVYTVSDDGSVKYFALNFEDYRTYINNNPNDEGGQGSAVNLDGSNGIQFIAKGDDYKGSPSDRHRFVVVDDVEIQANGAVTDFTITPEAGAKEDLDAAGGGGQWSASFPPATGAPAQRGFLSNAFTNGSSPGQIQIPNSIDMDPPSGEAWEFFRQLADEGLVQSGSVEIDWGPDKFLVKSGGIGAWSDFVNGSIIMKNVSGPNSNYLSPSGSDYSLNVNGFYADLAGGAGAPTDEFDKVPGNSDTTTVDDVEVAFDAAGGARVAAPGDVRIAGDVKGEGASIKANGQIRLVGMGFDIDSGSGEEGPAISLYATDDIVISTLKPDGAGTDNYTGMELKGLLYSWKNVELKTGHKDEPGGANPQRIYLQGAMVAYGGEPGVDAPGTSGGDILISGDLVYDPAYLLNLRSSGTPVQLEPLSRAFR